MLPERNDKMKIIHCSDLHLDSKMKSNLDSMKAKERRDEILRTYQNMVEYASKNDVKIIIIAGDMFDKKNITVKAKEPVKEPEKPAENTTGNDGKNTTTEKENTAGSGNTTPTTENKTNE